METIETINSIAALSVNVECVTESGIKINGLSNINENLSCHYIVYRIDNILNGKHYIGQHHTTEPLDDYLGSGSLIIKAVEKNGTSAFIKTILFDFEQYEAMDKKEEELVQISDCYPQDPMSYNLAVGGHGGNKFAGKTEEEKKKIIAKRNETRRNWSEEQRQQHKEKCSKATRMAWENKSEEEKATFRKSLSEMQTRVHALRSDEFQLDINSRISQTKRSYSKERKSEIAEKTKETISHRTDEEKQVIHDKQSASAKRREQTMSEESKRKRKEKRKETLDNKSPEEKQASIDKWHESMNARTPEEKSETTRKRLASLACRSDEEKMQSELKRKTTIENKSPEEKEKESQNRTNGMKRAHQNNPNLAIAQSKRMSGKGNPNYGRRWMVNPITNDKVYAKKDEIQKYLNDGYVFGCKVKETESVIQ